MQISHKYVMGTVMGTEMGTGWALDGHWIGIVYPLGTEHIAHLLCHLSHRYVMCDLCVPHGVGKAVRMANMMNRYVCSCTLSQNI